MPHLHSPITPATVNAAFLRVKQLAVSRALLSSPHRAYDLDSSWRDGYESALRDVVEGGLRPLLEPPPEVR